MGKKALHDNRKKGKKEAKELDVKTVACTLNLHRRVHKCTFKKKAPTAVKQIKEHARKTMYTKDVRIDPGLNQHIWKNGVRNLERKVDVVMERKKNDQEDAKHKLYTLVKLA